MRPFILVTCIALIGLALSVAAEDKPTNFVFILVDDLGWTDLGCFGSTFYETPNVDRLATEGMRFTSAYAACPVCSPTRASIMAGKYPARMDTTDWFGAPQPKASLQRERFASLPLIGARYVSRLPLEELTIAEALREKGYATFFAGKWHLGEVGYWPEQQGFDVNVGGHHKGSPPGGYFSPYKNPAMKDGEEGEHLPDRLARETASFIQANKEKPFLAYLSFYSVHTPLMAREDLKAKYEAKAAKVRQTPVWGEEGARKVRLVQNHAVYGGMVEAMDAAVGRVLAALEEAGVADRTAVIFMSDNGGLSTSEGHPTSNLPLRAGKGWLYEGGIREPMIVKWPGVARGGSVCDVPVMSTDFYPTMLEMGGLSLRPEQHMDGESFVGLLRGETEDDREALYWHYPHYGNQGSAPGSAIRSGEWKLIWWHEDDRRELYHLGHDLGEEQDVAARNPQVAARLYAMLRTWLEEVDAKMPTRNANVKP